MSTIAQNGIRQAPSGAAGTSTPGDKSFTYITDTVAKASSQLPAGRTATLINSKATSIRVRWGGTGAVGSGTTAPVAVTTDLQLPASAQVSWTVTEGKNDVVSVLPDSGTMEVWVMVSDGAAGS